MKRTIKYTFSSLLVVFSTITLAVAQGNDDVVMRAITDELDRSMSELQYKDYQKPFYIRYGINESSITSIQANLGTLVGSSVTPFRNKYVRVMVGDYEFNDESIDSDIQQTPAAPDTWQVPLGDDYYGIRRALWLSTDQVYKSASRIFDSHLKYVKAEGKPISELPHRRFAKVPVVNYESPALNLDIDQKYLEDYAKDVSSKFLEYSDLLGTMVNIQNYATNQYFVNSEGSKIKSNTNLTMMRISAARLSPEGSPIFKQLTYIHEKPTDLPAASKVKAEIGELIKEMTISMLAPAFDDSYEGPVLFLDEAVPMLFNNKILNKFVSSDIDTKNDGYGIKKNMDPFDEKIGEKVSSPLLSISLLPTLKQYEGTALLGSYEYDNQGVAAPEELVLLEEGILKNVRTDRTLAKDSHKPTGTSTGPGVVSIKVKNELDHDALKASLIELAKEEDLEYGLIVKKFELGRMQMCNVYKVSVEDGSEKLMSSARLSDFDFKSLKKIAGASPDKKVYNFTGTGPGSATSYIVHTALLIEDVEIEKNFQTMTLDLPLVESPF
ncbi:MAG: hypothetical protein JXQ96_11480 [Cyclobacteriaceae bacterium]